MVTYQQTAAPAPARSGGPDVAAWALVAVVVALVCAGAGWAIARQDSPSTDDLARTSQLAARDGQMRGQASGYAEGARAGRKQAALRAQAQLTSAKRAAAREGYKAGYADARFKAGDPDAYFNSTAGSPTGAYPEAGYEDVLASEMGSDEPGFSSSAYDAYGYGTGAGVTYTGAAPYSATSTGDEY